MQKAYTKELKTFGEKIKSKRKELGKSQKELAGLCEVDYRTIQRIEKGEYGLGLHLLYALADALETTASELVTV